MWTSVGNQQTIIVYQYNIITQPPCKLACYFNKNEHIILCNSNLVEKLHSLDVQDYKGITTDKWVLSRAQRTGSDRYHVSLSSKLGRSEFAWNQHNWVCRLVSKHFKHSFCMNMVMVYQLSLLSLSIRVVVGVRNDVDCGVNGGGRSSVSTA